ncbi:haloacid dehalogenase [Pacificimonas flava]|uniref:Haloacid dehalogenase n=2 Tax=Pacificimonas TaxID=1960290 RepID=A0A219B4B1_9SPHN|nr:MULTISPECIES: HAD-IB family hydrolase [Pacificimonas]MBZ6377285.1 HAD-IB family hydrolase [Pacificimonas aurantium]OWV33004.1 haloacid dehalogenase [Pacificimonas flava]
MQRISIFDMDRTITRGGTYSQWLMHWIRNRAPHRAVLLPATGVAGLAYLSRAVGRARLKELNQALLMGRRVDAARAEEEAERFAEIIVPEHCFPAAIERIKAERAEGRRVMLATASYAFYVRPIARRLRAEDVIATEVERDEAGRLLAKIDGENCYGPAKLRKIEAYFEERGIDRDEAHVRFFTDHESDAPVLDWADEAFAVNGKSPMKSLSSDRGWTQLDWA